MDNSHDRITTPSPDTVSRRAALRGLGGAALAGLNVLRLAGPARAFQNHSGGEVVPWLDQREPNPVPENVLQQLDWAHLDDWLTPPDQFFAIKHFNLPNLDEQDWRLEVSGLVAKPTTLTLADL